MTHILLKPSGILAILCAVAVVLLALARFPLDAQAGGRTNIRDSTVLEVRGHEIIRFVDPEMGVLCYINENGSGLACVKK